MTAWTRKSLMRENEELKAELKKLGVKYSSCRNGLRDYTIMRFLEGNIVSQEDADMHCFRENIKFISNIFMTVVVTEDSCLEKYESGKRFEVIDGISRQFRELIKGEYLCFTVFRGSSFILLLNLPLADEKHSTTLVKELVENAVDMINDRSDITIQAVISRIHHGFSGIAESYADCKRVLEYRTMFGIDRDTLYFGDISPRNMALSSPRRSYANDKLLGNCIGDGDYEGAKQYINSIIDQEFLENLPNIEVAKIRVFALLDMALTSIDKVLEGPEDPLYLELEIFERLTQASTIEEIRGHLDYVIDKIGEHTHRESLEAPPRWLKVLGNYIEENFQSPDINLSTIADHFDLNPAHVSRVYKKHNSIGIPEVIHSRKIGLAKLLLSEGKSIKTIAEQVGYNSPQAMIRAFKKYEGTTPGRFAPE